MRILLVEPNYYTQYPPLGLLKLSTFHKNQGDEVRFVRGLELVTRFVPDEIKVTSLFTWAWRPVWEAIGFYRALFPKAKISLGGIYASLTPEHARRSGADEVHSGLLRDTEDLLPDYALLPEWQRDREASIVFSHRGCIRSCGFCAVPKLEGKPFQSRPTTRVKHLVWPGHRRVILWDNNILGESHWRETLEELKEMKVEIDFNQGLDARLVTEEIAHYLSDLHIPTIRFAYDFVALREPIHRAITLFKKVGLKNRRFRHISCYVLYNYKDTPNDLWERVKDLLAWGVAAYPMRYQPLNGDFAFEKDSYVAPSWTREQLEMVSAARRVIGYGGAFPPYEGLVNKIGQAEGFDDAFRLRAHPTKGAPVGNKRVKTDADKFELKEFAWDLIEMGRDHQFPTAALVAAAPQDAQAPIPLASLKRVAKRQGASSPAASKKVPKRRKPIPGLTKVARAR